MYIYLDSYLCFLLLGVKMIAKLKNKQSFKRLIFDYNNEILLLKFYLNDIVFL